MRPAIKRNYSDVVIHFNKNDHVPWSLHNTVITVVRFGEHGRAGGAKQNATLGQETIFWAVRRMLRLPGTEILRFLLRFCSHGRNLSVRRINDQRCSSTLYYVGSAVKPEIVIGTPGKIGRTTLSIDSIDVGLLNALFLIRRCFLFGEKLFTA